MKTEVGSWGLGDRMQCSEDRRRKSEVGRQDAVFRKQKTEGKKTSLKHRNNITR